MFFVLLLLVQGHAVAASWTLAVDEREGLPKLTKGGAGAMSSNLAFWGANWLWAGPVTKFTILQPFSYAFSGTVAPLDLSYTGDVTRVKETLLLWHFELNGRKPKENVIGGGLVFKFDLDAFGADMGNPELLPNNRGWAWGRGGNRLEMRFEPAMAAVYFERGRQSEIRAYFYSGDIPVGKKQFSATISVGKDVKVGPTLSERYGDLNTAPWPINNLDWRTSPADVSFLNAKEIPAGKHGFVRAEQGHLQFADGTPARFWGTNITAATLFGTPKNQVAQQARRLSQLGFNLVRLHHHDSEWVNPNVFGNPALLSNTDSLSSDMLDHLDWWIKCLKDEGIYVWMDLHVGRYMRAGDRIEGFVELSAGKSTGELKGFNYVNPSLVSAMKRFNQSYVTHVNSYTGFSYKDEPAIAAMLITNENDVTHHFGNLLLPDKNVPIHNAWYMAKAAAFAEMNNLPKDRTWHSWEHGPSKLFLNNLEHDFNVEMIAQLRRLGVKVPLVTTSMWGDDPLSSLPALTSGEIIDVHAYGTTGDIERDPNYKPNLIHWMAASHVAGKPMTVTEWNVEQFPVVDRHTIPLYVAAAAAHQGWDAMLLYAYSQVPLDGPGGPSNWHAYNDPSLVNILPAAALLYRDRHVREATTTYIFSPDANRLFSEKISPDNSPALRFAAEKGKLLIAMPLAKELPWLKPWVSKAKVPGTVVFSDPNQAIGGISKDEIVSDDGELRRNWSNGTYLIDTPNSQALMGWSGGKTISSTDVTFELATPNSSVSVQSLDGKPIRQSAKILISLSARSKPKTDYRLPFVSELVEGKLTIHAKEGLSAFSVSHRNKKPEPISFTYSAGTYRLPLTRDISSYSLLLM